MVRFTDKLGYVDLLFLYVLLRLLLHRPYHIQLDHTIPRSLLQGVSCFITRQRSLIARSFILLRIWTANTSNWPYHLEHMHCLVLEVV